jgi:phage tail tape-measure protein
MKWKDVGKLVGQAAPVLGTALGGPAGGVLGSIIANAFGVEDNPDAVARAVQNDPQAALKLKELVLQNEQLIREHAFKLIDAELKDVQSAREMQSVALSQSDIFSKRFVYYFAILWSTAAMAYIGWITFGFIPENNIRFADTILGFLLGTVISSIFGYFFGTTIGSKLKTEMQNDASNKLLDKFKKSEQ